MCGFAAIYANQDVAAELYDALLTIQHRGQDAAGIVTYDGNFHLEKDEGLVREIFDSKKMQRLTGNMGVAHVRYPTVGHGGKEDAQPFLVNSPFGIVMAHNGNLFNCTNLKDELFRLDLRHVNSGCDVEIILNLFAAGLTKQKVNVLSPENIYTAVQEVFDRAKGSYSVVGMIAGQGMVAFRDPFAIRPMIMGKRETSLRTEYMFASETVALTTLGFEVARDVQPGEAIFIDMTGELHSKIIERKGYHPCIFEYVYFARPDSVIDKISVYKSRLRMGEKLAAKVIERDLEVDVVVPVPDSAKTSAITLAANIGVKYREGLVKNRYIGRTFIMPGQEIRKKSVRQKLSPVELELKGKKVLLVDDSIVRGTTSKKIIQMVRDAGAEKVYFASCAPPLRFPCPYGIDLPTKKDYIANNFTEEEVAKAIGADELIYQDLEDLKDACGLKLEKWNPEIDSFCTACFDGHYPTQDINEDIIEDFGRERKDEQNVVASQVSLV
ncbi:MAG: amidophosphoribosyltransferase [Candidatus Gracilibacteria bacterium]|nr:amidophosphoribosyltransferase [Candidatus Gracilibacteria bacterium]